MKATRADSLIEVKGNDACAKPIRRGGGKAAKSLKLNIIGQLDRPNPYRWWINWHTHSQTPCLDGPLVRCRRSSGHHTARRQLCSERNDVACALVNGEFSRHPKLSQHNVIRVID